MNFHVNKRHRMNFQGPKWSNKPKITNVADPFGIMMSPMKKENLSLNRNRTTNANPSNWQHSDIYNAMVYRDRPVVYLSHPNPTDAMPTIRCLKTPGRQKSLTTATMHTYNNTINKIAAKIPRTIVTPSEPFSLTNYRLRNTRQEHRRPEVHRMGNNQSKAVAPPRNNAPRQGCTMDNAGPSSAGKQDEPIDPFWLNVRERLMARRPVEPTGWRKLKPTK